MDNPLLQPGNGQVPIPQIQPQSPAPTLQMPQIGMAGVLDNNLGSMVSAPPSSPQEVEQRKGVWSQMMDDPNFKSAILHMGLNLLQGQQPNESVGGTLGRTASDAMNYYAAKNEIDRKNALQDQKAELDKQNVQSEIGARSAQTAQTQQATSEAASKFNEWQNQSDLRRQTAQQTVDNLVTEGKVKQAQLMSDNFKNEEAQRAQAFKDANPDLVNSSYAAELNKPVEALALTKAQTSQAGAAAANYSADAALARQKTQDLKDEGAATPDWISAMKGDEEAQLYALVHKDTESQPQILADIAAGKHHGISRKLDRGSASAEDYTPMVTVLSQQYAALPPDQKVKYPTLSSYIVDQMGSNMAPGAAKPVNEALKAVPNAPIQYVRDANGKLVPKQ